MLLGLASEEMAVDPEKSFVEEICLPFLRNAQNADGGWGFHPTSVSRAEPTCWALQALFESSEQGSEAAAARGLQFLRSAQLADGSWPFTPEEKTGCWVTSLCCWVLQTAGDSTPGVAAGLKWLGDDWPRDTDPWRRFLRRFSSEREVHPINDSYRGWGWTPGTSSWVEPTSFALLTLERTGHDLLPANAKRRRELAEALLCDRMCPGGGWNSGNPRVYGVPGSPLVIPTVWSLLALRHHSKRSENVLSLAWLEGSIGRIQGAGSLALARICLEVYGREWPDDAPALHDLYERNGFLENVQVAAWSSLALGGRSRWLASSVEKAT
jgi:Squalene-hopene cyclase C-terminal domain